MKLIVATMIALLTLAACGVRSFGQCPGGVCPIPQRQTPRSFDTPQKIYEVPEDFVSPPSYSVPQSSSKVSAVRASDAVVRLPSHGGSGTIIGTGEGWTLILSCGHCFNGDGRNKAISVEMAHPSPTGPVVDRHKTSLPEQKVGVNLLAVDRSLDLSLIRVNVGPVPYVSPVAPVGYQTDPDCWSCGFDEMSFPLHARPAKIVRIVGTRTETDARPWHGRSGGGLIEKKGGYLVGVCSAYSGPKNHAEYMRGETGIYVSLPAIHKFLRQAGVMTGN